MRRREFITLLGGAAAWPLVAIAQRVGVPMATFETGPEYQAFLAAFPRGTPEARVG
jgi:hypothetical protein